MERFPASHDTQKRPKNGDDRERAWYNAKAFIPAQRKRRAVSNKASGLIAVAVVGVLTVGAFALGVSLGPQPRPGHSLYRAQKLPAQPEIAAFPSGQAARRSPGTVVFTSASPRTIVADSQLQDAPGAGEDDPFAAGSPALTFQRVYDLLKRNYVDTLPDDSKLGHGAAAAMLASLGDPESRFLEPAEMAELAREAHGEYRGLGAVTAVRKILHPKRGKNEPGYTELQLTVVAPLPGSPAQKAGLKSGDIITDISGRWIAAYDLVASRAREINAAKNDPVALNKLAKEINDRADPEHALSLAEARSKLDDGGAKPLALTVVRPGEAKPLTLMVDVSTPTVLVPVSGKSLPGGIGYLQISKFTPDADTAFDSALTKLGPGLKGLIVDLRSSPGGLLNVGAAVAGRLTTAQTFALLQTKKQREQPVPIKSSRAVACPIVVLVDGGTANTSELLAAVLRAGGSKLIGASTFGDATDVKSVRLRDGAGFTMTVGKFLTADRTDFATVGLKPDIAVADTPGADAPLQRALAELSGRVAHR